MVLVKQIPYHRLEYKDNILTIRKNKAILNNRVFIYLIITIGMTLLTRNLLNKSPDAFEKPISVTGMLFIGIFAGVVIAQIYLTIKRTIRLASDFELKKTDVLCINNKPICNNSKNQEIQVVVQDVAVSFGAGGTSTIGLSCGKKFIGLCYGLDEKSASDVAQFIAECFNYRVVYKESAFFPLYSGH